MSRVDLKMSSSNEQSKLNSMQINDSKAGMENLDVDKINSIILKHSKNSKFYRKKQMRDNEVRKRAEEKLNLYRKYTETEIKNAEKKVDEFLNECERRRDLTRTLVHIDMDAFYANVEIRDNPSLADKPMAVGSDSMLSTSNYIARRYGVRAAMPGFIARELCPELIIVPCNFRKYRVDSEKIMGIISKYDSNYSAMSLDEAFLDITDHLETRPFLDESQRTFPKHFVESKDSSDDSAEKITFGVDDEECVKEIRHRIYLETKLTASAGIAHNLRLAKLCSDVNKPNGQFKLEPNVNIVLDFVENLPIRKVKGIGPSTAILLDSYGIKLVKDLYEKRALIYLLETQNTFEFLMRCSRGFGGNRIEHEQDKKSLGHETTFSSKISNNKEELLKICHELCQEVSDELISENLEAQKVNLKIKTVDFHVYTRTKSLTAYTTTTETIYEAAKYLFQNEWDASDGKLRLRLIGVRVSDFRDINTAPQLIPNKVFKKTIDSFFTKANKFESFESNESCTLSNDFNSFSLAYKSFNCPHCSIYFEGNEDFFYQHIDSCF